MNDTGHNLIVAVVIVATTLNTIVMLVGAIIIMCSGFTDYTWQQGTGLCVGSAIILATIYATGYVITELFE